MARRPSLLRLAGLVGVVGLLLGAGARGQAPAAPAGPTSPGKSVSASAKPIAGKDALGPLLDEIFAGRQHRFCHDPAYPLTGEELQWCALVPVGDKRCPALRKACAGGVRAQQTGWRRSLQLELPALPSVGRLVLWILMAVVAALVLVLFLKGALATRRHAQEGRPGAGRDPARTRPPSSAAGPAQAETDVFRLLERARTAAAAGDHRQAVADAYAALLRKLEGAALIRVEAHRTNGDYLRAVGERQPRLQARVGEVVAEVERVEFGGQPPGADHFRFVHDRVVALASERLASLLPLLAALALLGAGCQPEREGWDDSPSGRSALRQLLAGRGLKVGERLSSLARLEPEVDTLVLLPEAPLEAGAWERMKLWMKQGKTLVIAGPPPQPPAWLDVQFLDRPPDAGFPMVSWAGGATTVTVPAGRTRLASRQGRRLLARRAGLYALELRPQQDDEGHEDEAGEGRVVVFADQRLFENAALLAPGNARYLVELLSQAGPRVQFAGALTGIVAPNPVASVTRGRLAPILLQLAFGALLFFIYKGAHFGRPRPEPPPRRRAFADHVRALGLVYARARAGRVSLEHYGAWATERLGERLRLGAGSRLSAVAEGIAGRTGRPVGEVMRLLVEARPSDVRPGDAGTGSGRPPAPPDDPRADAEAMNDLRALAALINETGAHRRGPGRPWPRPAPPAAKPPVRETRND